jgi:hypothetical protein
MLYIESFVHRQELSEIVKRWILDEPWPGDVRQLKRIVNFNSYLTRIWGDWLMQRLLHGLGAWPARSRALHHKGDLKDLVTDRPVEHSPRIDEMIDRYRRFPEDFYRETPIDGRVYLGGTEAEPRFLGTTRFKRYRRIAEKGSRRIADYVFHRIRIAAEQLADERAARLGIPREQLITPRDEMEEEFAHAERRIIKAIRNRTIHDELPLLPMPDVVGMKLIGGEAEVDRIVGIVDQADDLSLIEREVHDGNYKATNLRVACRLPRAQLLAAPPPPHFRRVLAHRGLPRESIDIDYRELLETAEDTVHAEVIVSTFQEFLESEIGRCMHEQRLLEQRATLQYNGPLANNIRGLMHYILVLCRAPGPPEITEVPIKMWVRYLPDTFEQQQMMLFVDPDLYLDAVEPPAIEVR